MKSIINKTNFMKTAKILMLAAVCMPVLAACEKDNGKNHQNIVLEGTVQEVSGTWTAGSTIEVNSHLLVPEGESLTIEPGVTVIFNSAGVGVNHVAIEFTVDGNLYCLGTESEPIRLTVAEGLRTEANTFAGLWGGIVAGATCEEMIIDHTIIEYMMGGNAIIADNIFSATGYDGAEAVNIKSGCKVDVARNIMFSPNTNGLKLSSSDQSEVRHQALIQAYNNTIINSGWRRDGEKGGCIYVEEMANVSVFNNLLVNCKFRAITPAYDEPGSEDCYDSENSMIDYNFYASGNVQSHLYFEGAYEDDGETLYYSGVKFPYEGYAYDHEEYDPSADTHSKIAGSSSEADALDPDFVGYSLDADPADYTWNDSWDFHVNAGSPVLEGYYTPSGDRMPFYATSGLTVNGQEYKSPAVQPWFGAFGTAE